MAEDNRVGIDTGTQMSEERRLLLEDLSNHLIQRYEIMFYDAAELCSHPADVMVIAQAIAAWVLGLAMFQVTANISEDRRTDEMKKKFVALIMASVSGNVPLVFEKFEKLAQQPGVKKRYLRG